MKIHRVARCTMLLAGFLLFFILEAGCIAQNAADAILGEWYSPDKDGKFLFYKYNGKYYGKVTWIKDPNDANGKPITDKANPDPALRNRPLMGMDVFTHFIYDPEENKWVDGKVYDSRHGDLYSCNMKLISNLVLEVHGFVGFSWLGKSAYFTRNK